MQKHCVSINTVKNIDEIEAIARQVGMEIVFKCRNAYVEPEDMNEEERIAWIDGLEETLSRNLELGAVFSKSLADLAQTGRRYASEMYSLIKRYRENPSKEVYYSILTLGMLHKNKFKNMQDCTLTRSVYSTIEIIACPTVVQLPPIHASCLVATMGENIMRYISFRENDDPVITIAGRDAEIIKAQMESQLDACRTLLH